MASILLIKRNSDLNYFRENLDENKNQVHPNRNYNG